MTNLFYETKKVLKENGKIIKDIKNVIFDNKSIDINQFLQAAHYINYDTSYGTNFISLKLKIVGDDWWLEREEYDGAECWVFKTLPKSNSGNFKTQSKEILNYIFEDCDFVFENLNNSLKTNNKNDVLIKEIDYESIEKKICDTIFNYICWDKESEEIASDEIIQKEIFEKWFENNYMGNYFNLISELIEKSQDISESVPYYGEIYLRKQDENKILKELEGI